MIDVEDLTDIGVHVDGQGQMHVLIGSGDEHQVEITASVTVWGGMAATIIDEITGHVHALRSELAQWVKAG